MGTADPIAHCPATNLNTASSSGKPGAYTGTIASRDGAGRYPSGANVHCPSGHGTLRASGWAMTRLRFSHRSAWLMYPCESAPPAMPDPFRMPAKTMTRISAAVIPRGVTAACMRANIAPHTVPAADRDSEHERANRDGERPIGIGRSYVDVEERESRAAGRSDPRRQHCAQQRRRDEYGFDDSDDSGTHGESGSDYFHLGNRPEIDVVACCEAHSDHPRLHRLEAIAHRHGPSNVNRRDHSAAAAGASPHFAPPLAVL